MNRRHALKIHLRSHEITRQTPKKSLSPFRVASPIPPRLDPERQQDRANDHTTMAYTHLSREHLKALVSGSEDHPQEAKELQTLVS